MDHFQHQPVLLEETISYLLWKDDGLYVDCTLGAGGHSEAILQRSAKSRIIGIDQDREAIQAASERLAPYGDRAIFVWDNFRNFRQIMEKLGGGGHFSAAAAQVDGKASRDVEGTLKTVLDGRLMEKSNLIESPREEA